MSSELIDLHCHCVPGIDDGVRSVEEGRALLHGLSALGFEQVVATPHMRPGLFDNTLTAIRQAFDTAKPDLVQGNPLRLDLACEHYFDDVVLQRILGGQGLPYPGGRAILLEFYEIDFPLHVDQCLSLLRRQGLLPVIAHPERYRAIRASPPLLERLIDAGAVALLDVAALVGKYGRSTQRCAEALLELELYEAACTDCHRPGDVDEVGRAMALIERRYGPEEVQALFRLGPRAILDGQPSP